MKHHRIKKVFLAMMLLCTGKSTWANLWNSTLWKTIAPQPIITQYCAPWKFSSPPLHSFETIKKPTMALKMPNLPNRRYMPRLRQPLNRLTIYNNACFPNHLQMSTFNPVTVDPNKYSRAISTFSYLLTVKNPKIRIPQTSPLLQFSRPCNNRNKLLLWALSSSIELFRQYWIKPCPQIFSH